MQVMIRYVYMNIEEPSGNYHYRRKIRFKRHDKALKTVVVHGQTYTKTIGSQQSQKED